MIRRLQFITKTKEAATNAPHAENTRGYCSENKNNFDANYMLDHMKLLLLLIFRNIDLCRGRVLNYPLLNKSKHILQILIKNEGWNHFWWTTLLFFNTRKILRTTHILVIFVSHQNIYCIFPEEVRPLPFVVWTSNMNSYEVKTRYYKNSIKKFETTFLGPNHNFFKILLINLSSSTIYFTLGGLLMLR